MKNRFLKLGIIIGAVLFLTNCDAQKYGRIKGDGNVINTSREVGNFDKMSVSGAFDVDLVNGKEGKMEIKIEKNLLPYLVTEVQNGNLKIKWKTGTNIHTNKGVHLTVYFKDLSGVAMSGSGDIVSRDIIKSDSFDVAVSGSGDITLNLDTNTTDARVSGSGDLDFKGSTDSFSARVSGSGDIAAYELMANNADVRISGSGGMTLSVSDKLYARISGSGSVKYKGNPKIEDIKVSGSGSVRSGN
jgi:hypothetical protein